MKKGKWLIIIAIILVIGAIAIIGVIFASRSEKLVQLDEGILLDSEMAERLNGSIDEDNWENYEDRNKIEKAIEKQVDKMIKSAKKEDVEEVLKFFQASSQERYKEGFENSPEKLQLMAEIFDGIILNYIAPPTDDPEQTLRIAEGIVTYNGQAFSVVFVQVDDQWLIESF